MKKVLSLVLAVVLCFTVYTPALAVDNYDISRVSMNNGEVLETKYMHTNNQSEYIISVKDSLNRIVESSQYNPNSDQILQLKYDVSTGQIIESATFTASDHYTIISEEEVMPSANTEAVEETENGNSVSSPQASDYGLTNSNIFSGYKIIGQISDFGATAKLHRHIDSQVSNGKAYKFDFLENMTVATVAAIIREAVKGNVSFAALGAAAIGGMASGFVTSIGKGILEGKLEINRFHYTYKVTVNTSRTATGAYCAYKDYYVSSSVYNNTQIRTLYQEKGNVSSHSSTGHSIEKVQMAIQTYLNGERPWNTVCSLGDS